MTVNDPWIRLQRRGQIFRAICMVLTGTLLLVCIVSLFIPAFTLKNAISGIVPIGSVFVFAILMFLSERNALQHRIQQYQRLLAGDLDLLAQDQPSLNGHALSLPTMIALRPKFGTIGLLLGVLVFLALIFACLAIGSLVELFTTPYGADTAGLIFVAIFGCGALFFGVFSWFLWWSSHCWVKVTEIGLEARFNGRRMQIVWDDARIFSVGGVVGPERPRIYTLSGEQGSVIWMQLMSKSQAGFYRPVPPFDLYQQQSQALLEVIANRTNLPLYDLRLPANKWYL